MMRANGLFADEKVKPFRGKATKSGRKNEFLRKVMCTGPGSQLVAMSIPPGQEIGEETQEDIDQTLFIVAGQGEAVLDGNINAHSSARCGVRTSRDETQPQEPRGTVA